MYFRPAKGEAETLFMVYGEPRGDYKILHMGCSTTKFASLSRISTGISVRVLSDTAIRGENWCCCHSDQSLPFPVPGSSQVEATDWNLVTL